MSSVPRGGGFRPRVRYVDVVPFAVIALAILCVAGYTTRSYVGALIPLLLLALAIVGYVSTEPPAPGTGDEVDAIPGATVLLAATGVLVYLGAVALGRRARA
jgi:hypothetical protein